MTSRTTYLVRAQLAFLLSKHAGGLYSAPCDVASRSDSREIQLQCVIRGSSVLPSSIVHGWLSGTTAANLLFAQISG